MTNKSANERPSAEECLNHPFFNLNDTDIHLN